MEKITRTIFSTRMLLMLILGFASGLPLALTGQTLKWWASKEGLDLTTIGIMSIFSIPYSWKFLAGPFVDRYIPPFLGRRRGWLIILQVGLVAAIWAMSEGQPTVNMTYITVMALMIATLSSLQDVVVDAFRREYLPEQEIGFGTSVFVVGYRFGMMYATALAFALSDDMPMTTVYKIMAVGMLVGVAGTLLAKEPLNDQVAPRDLTTAFVGPFKEFLSRPSAFWILAFIFFYKIGDQMASEMTVTMYQRLGFSGKEVATIVKLFGLWAIIGGGLLGGGIILRLGLMRSLWIFGILQAVSTLGFAYLASVGKSDATLVGVITFENLTAGMGTAAFTAFMATMTNKRYTATQYALFTSLMVMPAKIFGGASGWLAEQVGWQAFFTICTFAAIPGMLMIFKIQQLRTAAPSTTPTAEQAS